MTREDRRWIEYLDMCLLYHMGKHSRTKKENQELLVDIMIWNAMTTTPKELMGILGLS